MTKHEKAIERVRVAVAALLEVDPHEVVGEHEPANNSHDQIQPLVVRIVNIATSMQYAELTLFSVELLNDLADHLQASVSEIAVLLVQPTADPLEVQRRTTAIGNLRQRVSVLLDNYGAVISSGQTAAIDRAQRRISELESQVQKVLSAAREAASLNAVSAEVSHFNEEAERDRKSGWKWLLGMQFFFAAAAALPLFVWYSPPSTAWSDPAMIPVLSAKIVLLSLASYGSVFCARNYATVMHNRTANRHRANAMKVFRAFIEGASDKDSRETVLAQACKAIFTPSSTGYLRREPEGQPHAALEVLRGIAGK